MVEGRRLGIDWGTRRLGIAVSDPEGKVAHGRATYERAGWEQDLEYLRELIEDENVRQLIIGVPINMDGSCGTQAQKALDFKKQLLEELDVSVRVVDERLTSDEAERVLLDADLTREQRRDKRDQLAATLILQRYLDAAN